MATYRSEGIWTIESEGSQDNLRHQKIKVLLRLTMIQHTARKLRSCVTDAGVAEWDFVCPITKMLITYKPERWKCASSDIHRLLRNSLFSCIFSKTPVHRIVVALGDRWVSVVGRSQLVRMVM